MKRYLVCWLLLVVGCTKASAQHLTVLTSADNPPYEMYATAGNHELVGFDIELMAAVGEKLGRKVVWQEVSFDGVVAGLAGKRADVAIAALTPTAERRKSVDFSRPYYQAVPALLLRQENSKWLDEQYYEGKVVGAQLGSTHERSLQGWREQHKAMQVKSLPNVGDLVQELRLGRLDGVLLEPAVAKGYSETWSHVVVRSVPGLIGEETLAIALPKRSPLLSGIDAALLALEQAGTLETLQCKWLKGCPTK